MKEFVINVEPHETRVAMMDDKRLVELVIERDENKSIVGNIYKGRVESIIPGIQAAFIDIGQEKNGFLYVSDIALAEGTGDFDFENGVVKPKKGSKRRAADRRIEQIIKKGQNIMVQVTKDTIGAKGMRLTNFVTLPGRFVVLMPTVNHVGVSRKIESGEERERLRKALHELRPKGVGLITRTAGEGKPREEIEEDVAYLSRIWESVRSAMETAKAPALLHGDLNPILRMVRDAFTHDFQRLTVDSEEEYANITEFLESFAPSLVKRCKLYTAKRPIFDKFGVDQEIEKALRRTVYLKSGGYLCIDQTEALVAIDVNTGKFTGKTALEETVFKTNLEAADEIARQIRLRDMGGIIVADFIDMELERNRRELLRRVKDALKQDRAKTTVSEVSELGMIELTRKRVKHSLVKALSQPCPYCEGSGLVRSVTTMTFDVLRKLRKLFCDSREKSVVLQVHPDVARRLRTENKDMLDAVMKDFGREITVEAMSDFHIHSVKIISARTRKEVTE